MDYETIICSVNERKRYETKREKNKLFVHVCLLINRRVHSSDSFWPFAISARFIGHRENVFIYKSMEWNYFTYLAHRHWWKDTARIDFIVSLSFLFLSYKHSRTHMHTRQRISMKLPTQDERHYSALFTQKKSTTSHRKITCCNFVDNEEKVCNSIEKRQQKLWPKWCRNAIG